MAKIIGGTATSSMLIPDWKQTNPNKSDYIKNKPEHHDHWYGDKRVSEFWDSSYKNARYHFKLFKFTSGEGKLLDADLYIRLGVENTNVGYSPESVSFYRYPCTLKHPYNDDVTTPEGLEKSRITFNVPRIIFEKEEIKSYVTHMKLYEKPCGELSNDRELWVEVKTQQGCYINNISCSAIIKSGEISEFGFVPKPYELYEPSGYLDSLTINSADWANKTAVTNISSRATANYASASGDGNRANGTAADVGGIDNTANGEASIVRGKNNTESGKYNLVGGSDNTVSGTNNVVSGAGNTVSNTCSVVVGNANKVSGGFNVVGGYNNTVSGEGSGNVGHDNSNTHKRSYTSGRYLKTGSDDQTVAGRYNLADSDSYFVVGCGTSESNRKNGLTVNKSGTPTKPTDAITKGYLENQNFATKNALSQVDKLATAVQAYVDDDLTPRVEALEKSGGAVDVVTQAEFNAFVADLQDDGGDFYVGLAKYANFASQAVTDNKGNEIDTTYATKTEMQNAIASAITTALNTSV